MPLGGLDIPGIYSRSCEGWIRDFSIASNLDITYACDYRSYALIVKINVYAEPMDDSIITSPRAPEPVGLYPHARRVGNLLFLSGVGPRTRGSAAIPGVELDGAGQIVSYDIEAQCRSVFANVKNILEDAGSSWGQIVDVTVFLTNMKDDFAVYNRLYAEYFAENQPCRTTIEVNRLPTPIAIELKVIATIE
jgi:2-aminomuconate deaminase